MRLAEHTTSRVGGPAGHWVTAASEEAAVEAVRRADDAGTPLLVLGGGSNALVADAGFPGTVVHLAFAGIEQRSGGILRLAAGQDWDEAVAWTVEHGLSGLEALSGIPGSAGATPVQNVGAYGADVSQCLVAVRAWDRRAGAVVELSAAELGFGYRDSVIKRTLAPAEGAATPRWVVLSVDFRLREAGEVAPVRYAQLARALGVAEGEHAPLRAVREQVLALRAGKGMVLDAADPDTWSTGSFFTNPIVPEAVRSRLPEGAPAFGAGEGHVKLSAAWLIEHAGFGRGFGLGAGEAHLAGGRASLSTKHTLAVTNRGSATAEDLLAIARTVRDGVEEAWGVRLHPEPVLVGCTL
ncbi:UDP-N-acetylmuramate dehydrogenase [Citricoccus sp. SGAir0253]|uniref:UDP-N-acetylmuramate dehydrogenase n=1 Tax=Citricoccus sp. SGAir0253 TaxID=2567881 RepID=UPI0010CCFFCB|nr:UDP-N-acetylmuramate dehydrogenase [Citricoccus sp. SGAir0253]QCU77427.1 UDP-N-acetylmuramate dehydrogenase [Citricoccus sp. SGAir0253]